MLSRQDVTGEPRWQLAREIVVQLREMPAATAESEVEHRLRTILEFLFPNLNYPEIATQYPSGDGPIDVYCRNVVFEAKKQGKKDDARTKADGTTETPEEQAIRYLNALTSRPSLFDDSSIGWRAGITDGKLWSFYDYSRVTEPHLTLVRELRLHTPEDDDVLLAYLHQFVDREVKSPPPTDDVNWANNMAAPFIAFASACENTAAYDVKRILWRDLLRGAFITPPDAADSERDLFARHTMLVVIARAVAETLNPPGQQASDRSVLHRKLTDGFASWLLDAADTEGEKILDELIAEVNSYDWSVAGRDTLKDLYHVVIPRNIRHDFGEYYTPDWLARAVCEEVMDADWRKETIAMAVAGQLQGPAVLDPSCGSGTFLYHATQLLLVDAAQHPELEGSREAQVEIVNDLVAGMDLHPVAVELAKTTKIAAFSNFVSYPELEDPLVYMGDSLQWESRRGDAEISFDNRITINTDDPDAPLNLPRSFLLNDRFNQLLNRVFDYADLPSYPTIEDDLVGALSLPSESEGNTVLELYRRLRQYIEDGRNHVWHWYIVNLVQSVRLMENPPSRLIGNPPWVVYNAMSNSPDRQDVFRQRATQRGLWAGRYLATQNDLAATFVATCVDYYLRPGGKFGFVMPYTALQGRQWESFRSGNWSLPETAGRERTVVDLSQGAWNFFAGKVRPFPWANSSVIFGHRLDVTDIATQVEPVSLSEILKVGNTESVTPKMSWDEARPLLTFQLQKQPKTEPSETYSKEFRNGATLFPQSLVVFENPKSRARGVVYFRTNPAKGGWKGSERDGQVEERFVKSALFSRLILPFGTTGHSYIIAPFDEDIQSVLQDYPQGEGVQQFNLYWSSANADYLQRKTAKSPDTLSHRIDLYGNLSAQLKTNANFRVVYNASGSHLSAAVVSSDNVTSHNLYWAAFSNPMVNHYLAAVFNARCLDRFFNEICRASDRDFMLLPVQKLPIPSFDPRNNFHVNLAAQSKLAHQRVAALVTERMVGGRRITRNDVLQDRTMQPILTSIDESVRAILPDYCS